MPGGDADGTPGVGIIFGEEAVLVHTIHAQCFAAFQRVD